MIIALSWLISTRNKETLQQRYNLFEMPKVTNKSPEIMLGKIVLIY